MASRSKELEEVRRLLRNPMQQQPSNDLIISQLFREEQSMLNRITGGGKSWTIATTDIVSVAGTGDYTISDALGYTFGKPIFAYRDLGDGNILPVPITDYGTEFNNQKHEFWVAPITSGEFPSTYTNAEKLGFYRTAAGIQKAHIFPVPDEVRTYKVTYAIGEIDPEECDLTDVPILPEWSHLRSLSTALFLLPSADWDGLTFNQNSERRKELMVSLSAQVQREYPEFQAFLRNPTPGDSIGQIGEWWE